MQLCLVDPSEVVCPVARIALGRRRLQSSDYLLPVEQILGRMQALIDATAVRHEERRIDVVVLCSQERTFAAFPTRARATLFIDVGFIELVVDFVGATYRMGDFLNFPKADLPILAPPYAGLTEAERRRFRDELFPGWWDFIDEDPEPEPRSPEEEEAFRLGWERMKAENPNLPDWDEMVKDDHVEVTGSQLFRDMACKMVEGLRLPPLSRKRFESVLLWGLGEGDEIHRPGAALFNAAALGRFRRKPDSLAAAQALHELTLDCASLIGLHEVAHALYDRKACADWRNSDEFASVLAILRPFDDGSEFGQIVASLWGDYADPDHRDLATRAIDEAFYDIRALAITIDGARGGFEHDVPGFFEMRLRVTSDGIMVKILREYLLISFKDPREMNRAGEHAHVETILRVMLLYGYLETMMPSCMDGGAPHSLFGAMREVLEKAYTFYRFFRADILNGLPPASSEEGHDFADMNLHIWSAFIADVLKAAPEAGPGS